MRFTIFDMETDALLDTVTKMHCFCATVYEDNKDIQNVVITDIKEVPGFLIAQECIVGHNIEGFDLPVIKKLTGYEHTGRRIDTLALSWYLYPNEKEHGLKVWGERVGVAKPEIDNWTDLSLAEYVHRCAEDVVINSIVFGQFYSYLKDIYFPEEPTRIVQYLTWKLNCAAEQEANPLTINREHCERVLQDILTKIEDKTRDLASVMPEIPKYAKRTRPKVFHKANGDLSAKAIQWLELLEELGLNDSEELTEVKVITKYEKPNPGSVPQLKAWLTSLGWIPTILKYEKNEETGLVRTIPQLQDKEGKLCPNILALIELQPELESLKGLFMLRNRKGTLEGFLEFSDENGKMKATINGFTNTLRFKHRKPIANLPGVGKPYGKEIRGAIIAPNEDYYFCGSDMSSLEDTTKQHYIYFYDPEYVKAMRVPGFDPHIDIGVLSNMITSEQSDRFKYLDSQKNLSPEETLEYSKLKKIRGKAKIVNFSGVYGAGPPKIAQASGMSIEEATILHTIYWERNKAVKQIANDAVFKSVRNQMWLFNPVSRLWYSLRKPKDRFSTLNQGTGVFCFDTHIRNVRNKGIKISLQYHDEIGFPFLKILEEDIRYKLNTAIIETNNQLRLNVPLGISIDIGDNYAEAH